MQESITIADVGSLFAAAMALMAYIETKKENKTKPAMQALSKIVEAAEKTESYFLLKLEGAERNREKEQELAEIWSQSALLISRIDKKLSNKLNAKSEYWRNPDLWETSLRAESDISLTMVRQEANKLIEKYA